MAKSKTKGYADYLAEILKHYGCEAGRIAEYADGKEQYEIIKRKPDVLVLNTARTMKDSNMWCDFCQLGLHIMEASGQVLLVWSVVKSDGKETTVGGFFKAVPHEKEYKKWMMTLISWGDHYGFEPDFYPDAFLYGGPKRQKIIGACKLTKV